MEDYQSKENTVHVYEHQVPKPKRFQFRKKDGTIIFQTGLFGIFFLTFFVLPIIVAALGPALWVIILMIGGIFAIRYYKGTMASKTSISERDKEIQ